MPYMIAGRSWSDALFRCPHCAMIAHIFSKRWPSFLYCGMWGTYSIMVTHPHGYSADCQFSMRFIVIPVGSSCSVIFVAHLFRILGATLESSLSTLQSTNFRFYLSRVPNLCYHARIGGQRLSSLSCSFIFVEPPPPFGQDMFFWDRI